jgi:ATP-binding cassette subfamily C protein CydC
VAVARALLRDAPVLLLDEPTAHLDALTERLLVESLDQAMQGRTAIVLTHRLVGMEAMNQIAVLDRGRITERGTHGELLAAGGRYRAMWDLQNGMLAG